MRRSLLVEAVEAVGGPLAVVVAGANVRDAQLLEAPIKAVVLERPPVEEGWEQHLCLDKGYDVEYDPHIALIRDERSPCPKRHLARRWVVERTISWLNACRAILVRYAKKAANYLGLIKLACALLWFRRYNRLPT